MNEDNIPNYTNNNTQKNREIKDKTIELSTKSQYKPSNNRIKSNKNNKLPKNRYELSRFAEQNPKLVKDIKTNMKNQIKQYKKHKIPKEIDINWQELLQYNENDSCTEDLMKDKKKLENMIANKEFMKEIRNSSSQVSSSYKYLILGIILLLSSLVLGSLLLFTVLAPPFAAIAGVAFILGAILFLIGGNKFMSGIEATTKENTILLNVLDERDDLQRELEDLKLNKLQTTSSDLDINNDDNSKDDLIKELEEIKSNKPQEISSEQNGNIYEDTSNEQTHLLNGNKDISLESDNNNQSILFDNSNIPNLHNNENNLQL